MLFDALDALMERVLHAAFQAEDASAGTWSAFQGRVIQVHLHQPDLSFALQGGMERFHLQHGVVDAFDACLRMTALDCVQGLASRQSDLSRLMCEMEGDAHLLQKLWERFALLDIQWEEALSQIMGVTAAHGVAHFVSAIKKQTNDSYEHYRLNATDFLQEELRILPTRIEADFQAEQVSALYADVDELSLRISALQKMDIHV